MDIHESDPGDKMIENPVANVCGVDFYDAPSEIEGSPYWVDLWASVNGHRLGLQIKPNTNQSASMSIYAGKTRASQARGHDKFKAIYGGKVLIVVSDNWADDPKIVQQIFDEKVRLIELPTGRHRVLGTE